jgi:hypothetical protein
MAGTSLGMTRNKFQSGFAEKRHSGEDKGKSHDRRR